MPELTVNGVAIDDTFAEAFDMRGAALVITAATSAKWAAQAAETMTGFATSVIACGCEERGDRPFARTNARRPPRRARAPVRGLDLGVAKAGAKPRRPMRAHESGFGLLFAGLDSGEDKLKLGDAICFSAMAGRSPRGSAPRPTLARAGYGRRVRLRIDDISH